MWRQPKETFDPDCLLLTVKHGGGSVLINWCVCVCGGGYIFEICWPNGFPSWQDQKSRLFKNFVRSESSYGRGMFPEGNAIFQNDNAPIHTAKIV